MVLWLRHALEVNPSMGSFWRKLWFSIEQSWETLNSFHTFMDKRKTPTIGISWYIMVYDMCVKHCETLIINVGLSSDEKRPDGAPVLCRSTNSATTCLCVRGCQVSVEDKIWSDRIISFNQFQSVSAVIFWLFSSHIAVILVHRAWIFNSEP
jgi:hypothetical protein